MSHPRGTIRAAVRAALAGSARFAGFTDLRAFSRDVDPTHYPFFVVMTPRELTEMAAPGAVTRATDVLVGVRRLGGDELEDLLDEDSAEIEALVLPVLAANGGELFGLETTETDVNADGSRRIGGINMTFRVVRYTPEGQAT